MNKETPLMRKIQVAISDVGARPFRNQVGLYELKDGRWLRSGLAPGSSDLVGLTPDGRFLSIEVKAPDAEKPTQEQLLWLKMVNDLGGVGFRARSVEEALDYYAKAT